MSIMGGGVRGPNEVLYASMKSEAFGGSRESPFRFRIPSTTVCSKEVGTGDQRANSNPQNARPCVWLLMTSDKSKLSAVGISPTTDTRLPFWSTETIFPRFCVITLVTAPKKSLGTLVVIF